MESEHIKTLQEAPQHLKIAEWKREGIIHPRFLWTELRQIEEQFISSRFRDVQVYPSLSRNKPTNPQSMHDSETSADHDKMKREIFNIFGASVFGRIDRRPISLERVFKELSYILVTKTAIKEISISFFWKNLSVLTYRETYFWRKQHSGLTG